MNILAHLKARMQSAICCLLLLGLLGGCSEHHDEFPRLPEAVANVVFAPSADKLIYSLVNISGPVLTGTYDFHDPAELDDASTYYWLADGVPITGATSTELDVSVPLTDANGDPVDLNTDSISFCVRPTNSSGLKGEDVCSPPIVVTSTDDGTAVISPPSATNLSYTPVSGPALNGVYTFADPQSLSDASTYYWLADGVPITGATQTSLDLSGPLTDTNGDMVDLNTDTISFCVRPTNSATIVGTDACSPPIVAVPSATGLSYGPSPVTAGSTLTGNYTFNDTFGLSDASTFHWLANGVVITGANQATLDTSSPLTDANGNPVVVAGTTFSFCVTPTNSLGITDTPVCVSPPDVSPVPNITIGSGGTTPPNEGEVITGDYTYVPGDDNSPEATSIGIWKVGGADSGTTCTPANGCTYTVANAAIGQIIEFCVTPVSASGMNGPESCSIQVTGTEIKIVGSLNYFSGTLTANATGFTGTYEWRVDTDDVTGPTQDTNRVVPPIGGSTGDVSTPPVEYRIGTYDAGLVANGGAVVQTNFNGIIDDIDWIAAGAAAPILHAGHFIGKDVEFCIITDNGYGTQCVLASSFQASDGSLCTDSNACVIDGIYYDYPDLTKRGIAPEESRGINFGGNITLYYRPMTIDELQFAADGTLPWGIALDAVPKAGTHTTMGMDFPLYTHSTPAAVSNAISYCQSFEDGTSADYHLPVGSDADLTDYYTGAPNSNGAPALLLHNIGEVTNSMIKANATYDNISPTRGWPLTARYWNAQFVGGEQYETDFTAAGTGILADTGNSGQNLISCVELQ